MRRTLLLPMDMKLLWSTDRLLASWTLRCRWEESMSPLMSTLTTVHSHVDSLVQQHSALLFSAIGSLSCVTANLQSENFDAHSAYFVLSFPIYSTSRCSSGPVTDFVLTIPSEGGWTRLARPSLTT